MTKKAKMYSFRLSPVAGEMLQRLAEVNGISLTACVELAIRRLDGAEIRIGVPREALGGGEIIGAQPGPETTKAELELARFLIGVARREREREAESGKTTQHGTGGGDAEPGAANSGAMAVRGERPAVGKVRRGGKVRQQARRGVDGGAGKAAR